MKSKSSPAALEPLTFADRAAAAAFTRLLDGQPLLAPLQPGQYGPWMGQLHLVAVAFAAGGQPAAAAKFAQLARRQPALRRLLVQCAEDARRTPPQRSLADLLAALPPAPHPVIPGLVETGGLTILAGKPRAGKTWLSLQLALAAASGSDVQDLESKVLFLALEDPPWRLQRRLYQLGARAHLPLHFATTWPLLDGGGLQCLAAEMARGFRLVVIDTFTAALSRSCLEWPDRIVQVLARLHTLAAAFDAALLLLDRHRCPAACPGCTGCAGGDNVDLAFAIADRLGLFAKTMTLARTFGRGNATLHLSDHPRPIRLARHPDLNHDPEGASA
jgi:hypothetical protein